MIKNSRRLFVDCQVFQHNTWNRGMGRYSLKFLEAIDKEETIELTLILNKNIPIDKDRIKAIKQACPSATLLYLKLSEDPNKRGGWKKLQAICAAELDEQLGDILKPSDTYLIASNFSIRYCSAFPTLECRKAVIFWDLTPYLQWADYKNTPDFEPKKYFAQFEILFAADQLWAISQSAAEEAEFLLGIDADKITNIRGASIRNMDEKNRRPKVVAADTHFVICPSADGPHKNNENMVRAFAEFNAKVDNKYKLVITSDFSEQSKDTLGAICADLIFSGHVSDGELGWLYEHCEALLFASKTEGLGLPILEAVGAGKKVVCSNIKVFKEISETAFYYADPSSPESIAEALDQALITGDDWSKKKKEYADISHNYSWPTVAKTCSQLLTDELKGRALQTPGGRTIWYADSDKQSLSRDVAEILYVATNGAYDYRVMRPFRYTYNFPSYLLDMGVATNGLDTTQPTSSDAVYIIDDSEESAQLMLRALDKPGTLVVTFSKSRTPASIRSYLKRLFDDKLAYGKFIELLELAGNRLVYKSELPVRGGKQFVEEVAVIGKELMKEGK